MPNVRLALQHNIGLGGAVVVTLYRKGFPSRGRGRGVGAAQVAGGSLKSAIVFDAIEDRLKKVRAGRTVFTLGVCSSVWGS